MPLVLEPHPDHKHNVIIDGSRCRHLASQYRDDRNVEWDKGLHRTDFKKLDGNKESGAVFARTKWKGWRKDMVDVILIKDDDEVHLYEIL